MIIFWEPACGQGHLARVFDDHDFTVLATDKIYRGYGVGGIDFLNTNLRFDGDVVTNPPFSLAQQFVEHALQLVTDGSKVCMLLRVQFLESKARKDFFAKYLPKTVWISSSRIDCGKNGDLQEQIA